MWGSITGRHSNCESCKNSTFKTSCIPCCRRHLSHLKAHSLRYCPHRSGTWWIMIEASLMRNRERMKNLIKRRSLSHHPWGIPTWRRGTRDWLWSWTQKSAALRWLPTKVKSNYTQIECN
jgi:hypothetical protein